MKKCFTVIALFAMTFLAAQARAATNFSGEWKLNLAKSDYGPIQQFAPEFMVRTIKHAEPALHISTHQKGAQGEVTTELNYTTDGKPAENKSSKGSAKWTAINWWWMPCATPKVPRSRPMTCGVCPLTAKS